MDSAIPPAAGPAVQPDQQYLRLADTLRLVADQEGGPQFMGWPDRWWEAHRYRCANDHVSAVLLRSEQLGRDGCLVCQAEVHMTFPEDVDGPLRPGTNPRLSPQLRGAWGDNSWLPRYLRAMWELSR